MAARFLEGRGARIVGRNVRVGHGELDLVVDVEGSLVAVEVKTVAAGRLGVEPLDRLDGRQLEGLRRAMAAHRPAIRRLDAVGVVVGPGGVQVRWVPEVG